MVHIRTADPAADFPQIAALLNTFEFEPVSAERLHEWDARQSAGRIRRRGVALDDNGAIVGYSVLDHETWMPPGTFELWALVDPARRGQGIGAALYDDALAIARGHGAVSFTSAVRDDDPAGLRFATRREFSIRRHAFKSLLDLGEFDEARFAEAIAQAEARGLRFLTLADAGNTPANQHKLYELNRDAAADNPGNDDSSFPPFEEFAQFVFGASWFRADGQILAADGERWVGLAAVAQFSDQLAYNAFTGVAREYRRQGLALALKLLAIRYARRYGATTIATDNDSQNAPMLAINRKLGYQPQPGRYLLHRP